MTNDELSTDHEYDSVSLGGVSTGTLRVDLESIEYDEVELTGAVPTEDLRELVERWRDDDTDYVWDDYLEGVNDGSNACADELEALLDE